MNDDGVRQESVPASLYDVVEVPEEPFGIPVAYWKAGLVLFTFILMGVTLVLLLAGSTPHVIGALYAIPAILFAYFYRRKGVLIVYLLTMYFFTMVVVFRYPSFDDIIAAGVRGILLIAIALTVSYLTHYLLLEKRKYHAIFDNTENGVVLMDLSTFRILEMNARFALATGIPLSQIRNHNLQEFISSTVPLEEIAGELRSHCTSHAAEVEMRRTDGTSWIAVTVTRKISSEHAVITFIDITERRRIDEELRRCNTDSSLYLDIITHDINNMNTAALNYSRLLETQPGKSLSSRMANLIRTLEKISEIIRNISTMRRIRDQPARLGPVDLAPVILREIAMFPGVVVDYDGSTATVIADDMLSSVFDNLIGNAVKYGGPDPRVTISVDHTGDDVTVVVGDTGKGIPDALKPVVFDRFQRGDMTVSGRGLGLFICRSLVERYGGSIRVEDRVPGSPEHGAVFRFTLRKA